MRWVILVVAACAHTAGAGGGDDGSFRVFYAPENAKLGKHFQVKPSADCKYDNGRDARWTSSGARVEQGDLPPGLAIEDGAIGGVPTAKGTFAIRVAIQGVTCAGKAQPDQHVDVTIVVK